MWLSRIRKVGRPRRLAKHLQGARFDQCLRPPTRRRFHLEPRNRRDVLREAIRVFPSMVMWLLS